MQKFAAVHIMCNSIIAQGERIMNNTMPNSNGSQTMENNGSKSGSTLLWIGLVILFVMVFGCCSCCGFSFILSPSSTNENSSKSSGRRIYYSSYKSAVNDFEKALNKVDGDLMFKCTLPSEQYHNIGQNKIDSFNSNWGATMEIMKMFEKNYKIKFKIKGKTELDDYNINSLQSYYSYNFSGECPKIEKGYALEVEVKPQSKDDEKEIINFDVIYFSDDGWRVSEKAMTEAMGVPSPGAGFGGGALSP